jgi:hypothetical protein
VVDAVLHDPRVHCLVHRISEVGRKLLHQPPTTCSTPRWSWAATPFIVFEDADIDAAIDAP